MRKRVKVQNNWTHPENVFSVSVTRSTCRKGSVTQDCLWDSTRECLSDIDFVTRNKIYTNKWKKWSIIKWTRNNFDFKQRLRLFIRFKTCILWSCVCKISCTHRSSSWLVTVLSLVLAFLVLISFSIMIFRHKSFILISILPEVLILIFVLNISFLFQDYLNLWR